MIGRIVHYAVGFAHEELALAIEETSISPTRDRLVLLDLDQQPIGPDSSDGHLTDPRVGIDFLSDTAKRRR
jgi:hypothetical protein